MKKLILIFVSSILTLLLGELLLKSFFPLNVKNNHHKIFCRYDPLLGWKKNSDFEGFHITEEYTVKEKLNSRGLRGGEYEYAKKENEKRILIFGDSFAEAYMVDFKDMFSEVLKRDLNRRNTAGNEYYEVINFGTGGYSTDQELLYFKTEGVGYYPDITVLMFCVNDVWYNNQTVYWRGYKPMYELAGGKPVLTNVPVPLLKKNEPLIYTRIKAWADKHSQIYKRTCIVKDKITLALRKEDKKIPGDFVVYAKEPDSTLQHAWDVTEAIISDLKSTCDSVKSELIVFYVPSKEVIYDSTWQEIITSYTMSDEDFSVDYPGIRLGMICNRLGINFIDPTQILRLKAEILKNENNRIYFKIDRHLNKTGNKMIGEILAGNILNNK